MSVFDLGVVFTFSLHFDISTSWGLSTKLMPLGVRHQIADDSDSKPADLDFKIQQ